MRPLSNAASEQLMHRGSPSTRWPSPRHVVSSSLVGTAPTVTQGTEERFGSVLAEMTRMLQPLQRQWMRCAVPHKHKPVDINVVTTITTACLIMWQANMLPTKLLQGHNLASTISTTGIFGEVQEEKPSMSREELLDSNHEQSLSEDFKQTRMDRHTDFLFPSYLEKEAIEWSTQMLQQRGIAEMIPDGWCLTPAFISEQAASEPKRF